MNQVYRHTYVRNPQFGFPSIGLIPQNEPAAEYPPLSVMVTMVTASQLDGNQHHQEAVVEPKANNPPALLCVANKYFFSFAIIKNTTQLLLDSMKVSAGESGV